MSSSSSDGSSSDSEAAVEEPTAAPAPLLSDNNSETNEAPEASASHDASNPVLQEDSASASNASSPAKPAAVASNHESEAEPDNDEQEPATAEADADSPSASAASSPDKPAAAASNDLYDENDSEGDTAAAAAQQHSSPAASPKQQQQQSTQPTREDLFGEGVSSSDDSDDDVQPQKQKSPAKDSDSDGSLRIDRTQDGGGSDAEQQAAAARALADDDDEDDEDAAPPEVTIEVSAPEINIDLNRNNATPYFVKLPNFLSVDAKPFDPAHYEEENEEEDVIDEEGRQRLKLKCENTIRWRVMQDEDGNELRQSNSKIVRWSDGSLSLHLGAEIFDVHMQPMQDHNHLFIRQGAGLQAEAIFKSKMTFRPSSTDTMTHRKMTLNMADRGNKANQAKVIALADTDHDPDKAKRDMVRREEDKLRAAARREAQQRRMRERSSTGGLSAGYLESYDSDDAGESLSALKRSYKTGGRDFERIAHGQGSARYGYESDSDGGGDRAATSGRRVVSDEDEDEASGNDAPPQAPESSKKKKVVIDESDDDDDD